MTDEQPDPLDQLSHHLSRLPSIGSKTASRLAYHIARNPELAAGLRDALDALVDGVARCQRCCTVTTSEFCSICADPKRSDSLLCVVERPQDVQAIERSGAFRGTYHVLGGSLSPLKGIGPAELRMRELVARLEDGCIQEALLATNPTVEGDATALYIARLVQPLGIKVSRLARGVSVGAELEYTDSSTLARAVEERREMGSA